MSVCVPACICKTFTQVSRSYKFSLSCAIAEKNRRWHVFNIFIQQVSAVKEMKGATEKGKGYRRKKKRES